MSLMPVEQPRYEEMNKVIELFIKNKGPYAIAKELGIRKVDVDAHIENWKMVAKESLEMKDRVSDLMVTFDEHYSVLIQKAYEIVDEVDKLAQSDKETMTRSQMLSQKKGALDLIAKLEKDRIDILQKSGLLEAADMGDELAQMEEEKQIILHILQHDLCNNCKPSVMAKIGKMLSDNAKGSVVIVSE